jgi:RNA polymerase sigma-70 factor (ECF subfamily)
MRLCYFLTENEQSNTNEVNAVLALFCFHASRFESRIGTDSASILWNDQDKSTWDRDLIEKGEMYLKKSTSDSELSKYHLQAMIAYWHSRMDVDGILKWDNILMLYNRLLQLEYSPVAALNRTYALYKVKGVTAALDEVIKIKMNDNHLYHCLLAEFYEKINIQKQLEHLIIAKSLASTINDIRLIDNKITNAIRIQS